MPASRGGSGAGSGPCSGPGSGLIPHATAQSGSAQSMRPSQSLSIPSPQLSATGLTTPVQEPHVAEAEHIRVPGLQAPMELPAHASVESGAHSRAVKVHGAPVATVALAAWSTADTVQEWGPAVSGVVSV